MAQATVQHDTAHHQYDEATVNSIENQKMAMWLYLASEVVIFSILIAGYVIFRINSAQSVRIVQETLGIALVTVNTFILLASSYAMVMGLRAMEMGNKQGFYQWIGLTAVMGTIFLGGQFIEYRELQHLDITLNQEDFNIETTLFEEMIEVDEDEGVYTVEFTNEELFTSLALDEAMVTVEADEDGEEATEYSIGSLFAAEGEAQVAELSEEEFGMLNDIFVAEIGQSTESFGGRFYTPTAFHGIHVLIGVIWALVVLWRGYHGRYDSNPIGIEIFGLYWHFVDVVWILLFTLIYLI